MRFQISVSGIYTLTDNDLHFVEDAGKEYVINLLRDHLIKHPAYEDLENLDVKVCEMD